MSSSVTDASPTAIAPHPPMSRALTLLLAFCCGAIVANLYYAQPIVELIAPAIGLAPEHASLIVSLTQLGYAAGLLFLVPLADLLENRRLVVITTLAAAVSLLLASVAPSPSVFLLMALLVGVTSVSVQMLVPLAAHLASPESRGRVVGNIMAGLLLGILLARPVASAASEVLGWRGVFIGAAVLSAGMALLMALTLPQRVPAHSARYGQLLRSVFALARRHALLRQRSLYQGLMFASFSLFWTIVPIELVRHHGLGQTGVAIFALVGAVGAIAAPIAGRLADAGHGRRGTLIALGLAPLALLASGLSGVGLVGLVTGAILLDFAVQMNLVLGQREVYALDPHSRARLNAVYMTSIFIGGALGSALASPLYERLGWPVLASCTALLPAVALLLFVVRRRG